MRDGTLQILRMRSKKYSCYKRYDDGDIAYNFVKDIILDPDNITNLYRHSRVGWGEFLVEEYGCMLFTEKQQMAYNYHRFRNMTLYCMCDMDYQIEEIIKPAIYYYGDDDNIPSYYDVDCLKDYNDIEIFNLFALLIADRIIDKNWLHIENILNTIQ